MKQLAALLLILLAGVGTCWMLSPLGLLATPLLAAGGADAFRELAAGGAGCLLLLGGGAGGALVLLAATKGSLPGSARRPARGLPPAGDRVLAPGWDYLEGEIIDVDTE